ncbi:hypothetical protein HOV00_gp28 [Microbacterium phage Schubert]|uniref:Uncharacterized protein n=1 Tax=Microbacterium phage Schubert TaxID=2500787 RepID=A0A3Q9RA93_9CAUD|nr:hypothetical protein HOV00_gp28 [Microbacterium phage Schubert]AZV01735.1 hypothetical protein SEA_SCHUBERT_28 [Microbacterium phage Schubert]
MDKDMTVEEGIVVAMVQSVAEGFGTSIHTNVILHDLRAARANVEAALKLNPSGAANFLNKKRGQESVDTIIRATEMRTPGGLFGER